MRKIFGYTLPLVLSALIAPSLCAQNTLRTPWADSVNRQAPLPEYPRPQLKRDRWTNLNGQWDYALVPNNPTASNLSIPKPGDFNGKITVPYPIESQLSGVQRRVGKDSMLVYQRSFTLTPTKGGRVLLHFGAVDWRATVSVDGKTVGTHEGGYDPFSFDITDALSKGRTHTVQVSVWDPTDEGPQPRGKQVRKPEGIWYTPVTGIWQTVWLEEVPASYIVSTRQTPTLSSVTVSAQVFNARPGDLVEAIVLDGGREVLRRRMPAGDSAVLAIPNPKTWSPSSPHLYDIRYGLVRGNSTVDRADAYFGLRTIGLERDSRGILRTVLNGKFLFQYGPLDQGWWPDGLYTAPTDAALLYDIEQTKAMGFNTIRKHVKTEPARWYWHCDRLGMLVWQDMPSGDMGNRWESRPGIVGLGTERERSDTSEAIFRAELTELADDFYNFPSIVVWVPFNEAWGQFKTEEITEWMMRKDPSRLVNAASGGNFTPAGHIIDLHNYPEPAMPSPSLYGKTQALVLGEFGGLGLPLEGHTWQSRNNWGYQSFKNADELQARYAALIRMLPKLIDQGLSAAIYTQTTDVEVETNGLMTYDRRIAKMKPEVLRALHALLYAPIKASSK